MNQIKNLSSLKFLINSTNNPQNLIAEFFKNSKLTQEFINEYKELITPEIFTFSYKLSSELVNNNLHLFLKDEFLKKVEEDSDPTEETGGMNNLFANFGMIADIPLKRYSLSLLGSLDVPFETVEESLPYLIRNEDKDEFYQGSPIFNYFGKDGDIDDIYIREIKDQGLRDSLILTKYIEEQKITPLCFKLLSQEEKKEILETGKANINLIITALIMEDYCWQYNTLSDIESGKIVLDSNVPVDETNFKYFISKADESIIELAFCLKKYYKNLFNYNEMLYCLENKAFSETQLCNLVNDFIQVGLKFELKKYAQKMCMPQLLATLDMKKSEEN